MDKYTVDLDQVLNDFEYSELTDQYSNARSTTGSAQSPIQNNVAKHSINNVFLSLNEYLNTNINVNNLNQIDNNLLEDNFREAPVLSPSQNHFKDFKEQSIKDCNLKTDELLLDFSRGVKDNNNVSILDSGAKFLEETDDCRSSTLDSEVKLLEETSDSRPGIVDSEVKLLEETGDSRPGILDSEVKLLEETGDNRPGILDGEVKLLEETGDSRPGILDGEVKLLEETGDSRPGILDSGVKLLEETSDSSRDGYVKIEDVESEKVDESLKDSDKEEIVVDKSVEDPKDVERGSSNAYESLEDQKSEDNREIIVKEEVIQQENENKTEEVSTDDCEVTEKIKQVNAFIEEEKKIGFSEDIDLDDSELNKLLEELESEDLEESKEESPNIMPNLENCDSVRETKEDQACSTTVEGVDVTQKISVDNDVKVDEQQDEGSLLVSIEDKVSKKVEEHVEEKSLPALGAGDVNIEENIEVRDKDTVADNGNMDKSEEIVEIIDNDKEESIEVLEEKVSENDSIEMEKETSQDSLSRPQNLPLTVEGEEPKRKINLIGDPGSTPYNNVYINKEIPRSKVKEYDSDTDYSTSSSPTFSDASSTASTASIDEVRTEDDKTTGNPVSLKNTNETVAENEELTRTASEMDNPPSTESGTADPQVENPTSETENPTSDQAPPASQGGEASESAADERLESEGAAALSSVVQNADNVGDANVGAFSIGKQWLGKEAPLWIPDSDAMSCLHCDMKFTVLKRRHHCRACGLVLCSKCCHLRFRLEYLDAEARVCNKCHDILNKDTNSSSGSDLSPEQGNSPSYRPNPNNPLEYCSTVSPLQQAAGSNLNPPSVMVPVGVLKRKGSNKAKSNKSVMFCDGIRPGSDLTNLDNDFDYNNTKIRKPEKANVAPPKVNRNLPIVDPQTNTFIPSSDNLLPPTVTLCKTDISYSECTNDPNVVETLKTEQLTFAIHVNLYVHLKVINMNCCINKMAWCFSTEGLINVGQDEIVILLEYIDEESFVPKDVFYHINNVYNDAVKGNSVKEMGLSLHNTPNFLDSKNHAGFVYIRPTFQCLENVIKPKDPYLIGILIHRWETPWAKLFPLRLILRLGAEYRYYPSPIISTRHRESVFVEIGHTIINILADFRNFSYTLPQIRGLTIHMEDKNTTVTIPVNRYDQVMKSINNSSDHILAFAGNFSLAADSHLVCIQDTQGNENCYSTHAINIQNKPRKITGASFIVFNGALKSSSGLTAKSNIVEDGLMIQVLPEHMQQIRESLRAMKNHTVSCGCVNAASDETVNIVWGENDVNFNVGIVSTIDGTSLSGIPSIRVHNGKNHVCVNGSRLIRWTEVFIIKSGDDNPKSQDPVDVSRVSESIAKATCDALVKYLDLLVANSCQKIGIRTTLHIDNVSYLAGSNGAKLAPIYMKSLDDELIPVLHRITTNNLGDNAIILELIFRILNV